MGFLDRLRGRGGRGLPGGSDNRADSGVGAAEVLPTSGAASATAWSGLPPLQRSVADGRAGVADAGFGKRLPTWQNPSFTGARSRIGVLDTAVGGLLSGAMTDTARPVTGLERPLGTLFRATALPDPTVQRAPAAPLWAVPPMMPTPGPAGEGRTGTRRRSLPLPGLPFRLWVVVVTHLLPRPGRSWRLRLPQVARPVTAFRVVQVRYRAGRPPRGRRRRGSMRRLTRSGGCALPGRRRRRLRPPRPLPSRRAMPAWRPPRSPPPGYGP
ncbi:hypothetical protein GCM10020000_69260 [Streptomyces olivoverticillatus]